MSTQRPALEVWYATQIERWKAAMRNGTAPIMDFDDWITRLEKGGEKASGGSNFSAGQRSIPRRPSRVPRDLREMVEGR